VGGASGLPGENWFKWAVEFRGAYQDPFKSGSKVKI